MIRETRDREEIASVMRHYPQFAGADDQVKDRCRYFVAERNGEIVGLVFFDHLENKVWRGHFLMLPAGMGRGVLYARQALKAMSDTADRVIGMTPIENTKALRAAFAVGMRYAARTEEFHVTEYP